MHVPARVAWPPFFLSLSPSLSLLAPFLRRIERRNLEARLRKALTAEPHLAPVVERYGLFAQAEGSTRDAVNALVADIERELAFSRSFLPASGDHHDGDKAALEK